jgi:hypothetical protein
MQILLSYLVSVPVDIRVTDCFYVELVSGSDILRNPVEEPIWNKDDDRPQVSIFSATTKDYGGVDDGHLRYLNACLYEQ